MEHNENNSDTWRGNLISYDKDRGWLYEDKKAVADCPNKSCGYCGLENTPEGYDGCLGFLPGVMNACCGHGNGGAYIQFDNGELLRGNRALKAFDELRSI